MNTGPAARNGRGSDDATLDGVTTDTSPHRHATLRMVEASDAGLTAETRCILRWRLRAASLVMSIGFGVFLFWHFLNLEYRDPWYVALFVAHGLVTLVLALFGTVLCRKCEISERLLRRDELGVFGLPTLFFLFYQYVSTVTCAVEYQVLPNMLSLWAMLLFTYALFIPNSWQRAAVVLGAMAMAPIAMTLYLVLFHDRCAAARNADVAFVMQSVLTMAISAVVATLGVFTIGQLRREAYEARQLGQYRLRQLIGRGGMGEVFLAEHQLLKRRCAIKLIRSDKAGDPTILARFEREVRMSAKLSHWNNIDIFDYGRTDDGTFYYVMEYLPGLSINDLVTRYGPLPASRVIHLLAQTCDALGEAHAIGLIHRDIKPANIFAAQRGGHYDVAKLLDFGLAKPLSDLDPESEQLTQVGSITGSPTYISPEQAMGEGESDARSDLYSLGGVGFFMLTGRPPFNYDKPMRLLVAHARETPIPPSEIQPDVPRDLEAVIFRCLAKDPSERYQSAGELYSALMQCEAAGSWTSQDAREWWTRHASTSEAVPELAVR